MYSVYARQDRQWPDGGASVFRLRAARVGWLGHGAGGAPAVAEHIRQVRHALLSSELLHAVASHRPHRRYGERETLVVEWLIGRGEGMHQLWVVGFYLTEKAGLRKY